MKNRPIYLYSSPFNIPLFLLLFPHLHSHQNLFIGAFFLLLLTMGTGFYILFSKLQKLIRIVNTRADKKISDKIPTEEVALGANLFDDELQITVEKEMEIGDETPVIVEKEEVTWLTKLKEQIKIEDIVYLKAEGNGVHITGEEQQIWLWKRMKECEVVLPKEFVKVHRSYIVNLNYLKELKDGNMRLKGGKLISIGNTRKNEVKAKIDDFFANKVES